MKIKTSHRQNPKRAETASKHYGDSKGEFSIPVRSYVAETGRSIGKMKKMLCDLGKKSDGEYCRDCESPCRFGEEYVKLKDKEGEDEGEKGNART